MIIVKTKFEHFCERLGLVENTSLVEGVLTTTVKTKFKYLCERLGLVENASLDEREC
jgi:hypothetical protein